ncbi:hypothetical protein DWW55_11010 [Paraprevotella clara]|nr:hypothetical protein DWW55_11010 [Paraprevotella clara]
MPGQGHTVLIEATWWRGAYWNCSGQVETVGDGWYWNDGPLRVGDELEIEFAEFDAPTPPVEILPRTHQQCLCGVYNKYCGAQDEAEMRLRMLHDYKQLRWLLEQEGLLDG